MRRQCSVDGCERPIRSLEMCGPHYQRARRLKRRKPGWHPPPPGIAECGHGPQVTEGRCWDCHLAHLRDTGQGARADRLVVLKRQRDEGRLDLSRLVNGFAAMYAPEFVAARDED